MTARAKGRITLMTPGAARPCLVIEIRQERPEDAQSIHRVVERAFQGHPRSTGGEAGIVLRLRAADALSVSLVALVDGRVRGNVAASPVSIAGQSRAWHGLGPLAVDPAYQRQGIGSSLVTAALARLQEVGSVGCVVLGRPSLYERFGFKAVPTLRYPGSPPEFFMALPFQDAIPAGVVTYHDAFNAA